MKIAYIAETSLTNRSAYTQHVIKMCDAFSQLDHSVTLFLPDVKKDIKFTLIKKRFILNSKKKLHLLSILNRKTSNFIFRLMFAFKSSLKLKKEKYNIILTRSFITSLFLSLFRIYHFLEIHSEFKSLTKFFMINLDFINSKYIIKSILISKALNKIFKLNKDKVLILHDGIDLANFKKSKKINKIKTATYVGSFYKGRGIELLITLAKKFKNINFKLYGQTSDNYKSDIKNLKFFDHIEYCKVPGVLAKSDLLLMPYEEKVHVRAKNINTAKYCSPLKMFDYLASGKIILSSRLDGICEVLKHNKNSIIIKNSEIKNWILALNKLINNYYNIQKLQDNSYKTAKKYTWTKRATMIIDAKLRHKLIKY